MHKVLIIDDDEKLVGLLTSYLKENGFETIHATHPHRGVALVRAGRPDLVILDVMMPDMDGFATLKEIRKDSNVPVIMLTARGDVTDRIVGLEIGADDYLAKPFEPRELLARISTVLRRVGGQTQLLRFGDLEIDADKRSASLAGNDLELSTLEFEVLHLLASKPNRIFNRDQISAGIKGIDWNAVDRSVDVLISRLRVKLNDDARSSRFIKTIRGTGYKFIGAAGGES